MNYRIMMTAVLLLFFCTTMPARAAMEALPDFAMEKLPPEDQAVIKDLRQNWRKMSIDERNRRVLEIRNRLQAGESLEGVGEQQLHPPSVYQRQQQKTLFGSGKQQSQYEFRRPDFGSRDRSHGMRPSFKNGGSRY